MAAGGIGDAALLGAALGGGSSLISGGDPLRGALLGGLTGGITGGVANTDTFKNLFSAATPEVAAASALPSEASLAATTLPTPASFTPPPPPDMSYIRQALPLTEQAVAPIPSLAAAGVPDYVAPALSGQAPINYAANIPPSPAAPAAVPEKSGLARLAEQLTPATTGGKIALGGAGLGALAIMSDRNRFGAPETVPYSGSLSKFSYSPSSYTPYTYKPYAEGGITSLGDYSDGGRLLRGPGDGVSDSIPAAIGKANPRPARLADGEFVVPARVVSELGNGSTDAGARELYKMMDRVQKARRKTTGKSRIAADTNATQYLPA